MTDEHPVITAAIESAVQTALDELEPGCTLSDWVITATGIKLDEIGERTHMFYLPRPEAPIHVTRGLAISGSDYWRHADEDDE